MKRHDRIAALVFLLVAVAAAVYSAVDLKLGTLRHPDSGFIPFLASVVMAAFSATWLWKSRGKDEEVRTFWGQGKWRRPTYAVALLLFYAWLMTIVGYVLDTLLFLLVWQFLIERERWHKTALVAVLGTGGMYLLFVYLLKIQVPPGIFGR